MNGGGFYSAHISAKTTVNPFEEIQNIKVFSQSRLPLIPLLWKSCHTLKAGPLGCPKTTLYNKLSAKIVTVIVEEMFLRTQCPIIFFSFKVFPSRILGFILLPRDWGQSNINL